MLFLALIGDVPFPLHVFNGEAHGCIDAELDEFSIRFYNHPLYPSFLSVAVIKH